MSAEHQEIKERLLSFNPSAGFPIIKRGYAPTWVFGQRGSHAGFKYAGWTLAVHRTAPTPHGLDYHIHAAPDPGILADPVDAAATTFDGAICAGKIWIDYENFKQQLGDHFPRRHAQEMWREIGRRADHLASEGVHPDRASVARAIEEEAKEWRRIDAVPPYYLWWEGALPLPDRVSMIDDKLELLYCAYGPDISKWPSA